MKQALVPPLAGDPGFPKGLPKGILEESGSPLASFFPQSLPHPLPLPCMSEIGTRGQDLPVLGQCSDSTPL